MIHLMRCRVQCTLLISWCDCITIFSQLGQTVCFSSRRPHLTLDLSDLETIILNLKYFIFDSPLSKYCLKTDTKLTSQIDCKTTTTKKWLFFFFFLVIPYFKIMCVIFLVWIDQKIYRKHYNSFLIIFI